MNKNIWLALAIGNSQLHWAKFQDSKLQHSWDAPHLTMSEVELTIAQWQQALPLYIASVVPEQANLWQSYPQAKIFSLPDIKMGGLYPSLGIDRALALLGAGETYGWPILAIDAGTAMTFNAASDRRQFAGGAILPGLRLQLQALNQGTAALPPIELPDCLPQRWAFSTAEAIASGVAYTVLAGIRDFIAAWCQEYPQTKIALTGGDRSILLTYLSAQFPHLGAQIIADPHLIFWGMRSLVR